MSSKKTEVIFDYREYLKTKNSTLSGVYESQLIKVTKKKEKNKAIKYFIVHKDKKTDVTILYHIFFPKKTGTDIDALKKLYVASRILLHTDNEKDIDSQDDTLDCVNEKYCNPASLLLDIPTFSGGYWYCNAEESDSEKPDEKAIIPSKDSKTTDEKDSKKLPEKKDNKTSETVSKDSKKQSEDNKTTDSKDSKKKEQVYTLSKELLSFMGESYQQTPAITERTIDLDLKNNNQDPLWKELQKKNAEIQKQGKFKSTDIETQQYLAKFFEAANGDLSQEQIDLIISLKDLGVSESEIKASLRNRTTNRVRMSDQDQLEEALRRSTILSRDEKGPIPTTPQGASAGSSPSGKQPNMPSKATTATNKKPDEKLSDLDEALRQSALASKDNKTPVNVEKNVVVKGDDSPKDSIKELFKEKNVFKFSKLFAKIDSKITYSRDLYNNFITNEILDKTIKQPNDKIIIVNGNAKVNTIYIKNMILYSSKGDTEFQIPYILIKSCTDEGNKIEMLQVICEGFFKHDIYNHVIYDYAKKLGKNNKMQLTVRKNQINLIDNEEVFKLPDFINSLCLTESLSKIYLFCRAIMHASKETEKNYEIHADQDSTKKFYVSPDFAIEKNFKFDDLKNTHLVTAEDISNADIHDIQFIPISEDKKEWMKKISTVKYNWHIELIKEFMKLFEDKFK